jgi:tripartite-type tricarboxylate transporter receptor subunit TctC
MQARTAARLLAADARSPAAVMATNSPVSAAPAMRKVPTIAEAGMPQFKLTSWAGVFGPAKKPREVVERFNREFNAALGRPDVAQAMEKQAFILCGSTLEQLAALVRGQLDSDQATMKAAGVEPE